MYLQKTPISNHAHTPSKFLHSAHFSTRYMYHPVMNQLQRSNLSPELRPGFCNSAKRVSESVTSLRNCGGGGGGGGGGLVRVKCGGCQAVHDNNCCLYSTTNLFERLELSSKLNTGFRNSVKRVSGSRIDLKSYVGSVRVRCGGSEEVHDDGYYIRRGVELAKKAVGHTSPNPMVGCLIVKDGKIVGEGFHPKAGQPHAEVFALRDAGDLAENATAYVTLEPCNHYGRTPPCTEALIKAKVKKVVVGMVDPNPIVASKGVQRLRDAGIEVIVSVEEEMCKKLIEAFTHKMLTGNPFVTLRYSMSVDGHLVNQLGEKAMESGGYYSQLLQEYDAVVYSSALLKEKFFPASIEPGANQPLQVVLARSPTSPIQIGDVTNSKAIIFTEKETAMRPGMAQDGIETVVSVKSNLTAILEHCNRQGLCSALLDLRGDAVDFEDLLIEGFEQNLFQKVVAEVLPIWGRSQEETWRFMGQMLPLKNLTSRVSGNSILLEGYF